MKIELDDAGPLMTAFIRTHSRCREAVPVEDGNAYEEGERRAMLKNPGFGIFESDDESCSYNGASCKSANSESKLGC